MKNAQFGRYQLCQLTRTSQYPQTTASMSRFGVLVMGPAGAGKSTFCAALIQHLRHNRRTHYYINLDPAADAFAVEPDLDIKELISLDDSMEELGLGPNGALIACFEYLLANMDFLTEPLDEVGEDSLIIIDMPGQIELYTHVPLLPALARELTGGSLNARLCAAYLVEATFVVDRAKFFAAALSAMSSMLLLGLPHVNILSKMDLVKGKVARREEALLRAGRGPAGRRPRAGAGAAVRRGGGRRPTPRRGPGRPQERDARGVVRAAEPGRREAD
jgi:GTPase SAR1 family protein